MPETASFLFYEHIPLGATRQEKTIHTPTSESLQTYTSARIDGSPLPCGPKPASLSAVIAQFKSRVTKRVWKIPEFKETSIWQRNYYEHILRNEKDLQNKTEYIEANPLLWEQDEENPIHK